MAYYREDLYFRMRDERDAAERRIAAALACHTRTNAREQYGDQYDVLDDISICVCGFEWDTVLDRCTSPTVTALVGEL